MRFPDLTWPVRLAWLTAGLLWLIWLGVDDRGVAAVLTIGTAISLAAALTGLDRWASAQSLTERAWWARWIVMGLAAGVGLGPLTVLLITIKISLHSHGVPDFDLTSVRLVLGAWPVWGLGIMLMSLALGLLSKGRTISV